MKRVHGRGYGRGEKPGGGDMAYVHLFILAPYTGGISSSTRMRGRADGTEAPPRHAFIVYPTGAESMSICGCMYVVVMQ